MSAYRESARRYEVELTPERAREMREPLARALWTQDERRYRTRVARGGRHSPEGRKRHLRVVASVGLALCGLGTLIIEAVDVFPGIGRPFFLIATVFFVLALSATFLDFIERLRSFARWLAAWTAEARAATIAKHAPLRFDYELDGERLVARVPSHRQERVYDLAALSLAVVMDERAICVFHRKRFAPFSIWHTTTRDEQAALLEALERAEIDVVYAEAA